MTSSQGSATEQKTGCQDGTPSGVPGQSGDHARVPEDESGDPAQPRDARAEQDAKAS